MEQQTLTPDEMLEHAYNRNIGLADYYLRSFPKPSYRLNEEYEFDFDPNQKYSWVGQWGTDGDKFIRSSDGEFAYFTKYSHIKIN